VILRGITAPPVIEQARNMQFNENAAQFLFSGTPTELLHALSALQFSDFSVTDPELDEIFLHYYAKEMP